MGKLKELIWLLVIISATIILIATHVTITKSSSYIPEMNINISGSLDGKSNTLNYNVKTPYMNSFEIIYPMEKEQSWNQIINKNNLFTPLKIGKEIDNAAVRKSEKYSDYFFFVVGPQTKVLDNINIPNLSLDPQFINSVRIDDNITSVGNISRSRESTVKHIVEKVDENSNVEWYNQEYEIILPIGSIIPNEVNAKYDNGTSESLFIKKINDNTFALTGFTKKYFNRVEISYNTNFKDVIDDDIEINGNYKFSNYNLNGEKIENNVIGIDKKKLINEYKLNFDLNGADYGNKPMSKLFIEGEKTHRPNDEDFRKNGYTFNGWSVDEDHDSDDWDFVNNVMPATETTLYANWIPNKYVVEYVTNLNNVSYTQKIEVPIGGLLEQPTSFSMNNYHFVGWYEKTILGKRLWDFNNDRMNSDSLVLYSKYELDENYYVLNELKSEVLESNVDYEIGSNLLFQSNSVTKLSDFDVSQITHVSNKLSDTGTYKNELIILGILLFTFGILLIKLSKE